MLRGLNADELARRAVAGLVMPTLTKTRAVDLLIAMLGAIEPAETRKHQDVVRAMALLELPDMAIGTYAATWLLGHEVEEPRRRELGFVSGPPAPAEIVRGLLWIMGHAGPTIIAIDQFDAIVSEANALAAEEAGARRANSILQSLAGGLMHLHDLKRRAMTLVSCLEATWPVLKEKTVASVGDRFRELPVLPAVENAAVVERLIARRLAPVYAEKGYLPPYATYPFTRGAVESAVGLRPRAILMRCHEHQEACLAEARLRECGSLAIAPPRVSATAAPSGETAALDEAFARARAEAAPVAFDDEETVGALVSQACELYLRHLSLPETIDGESSPDPNPRSPALHAKLVFVFHDEDDRQRRWGFRAIEQDNPIAFQSRLRAAMTASGVDANLKWRRMLVLRTCPPPPGPKSAEVAKEFLDAGGDFVDPAPEDFEIFSALSQLAKDAPPGFDAWLKLRKPLFATRLFYLAGTRAAGIPAVGAHGFCAASGAEGRRGAGEDGAARPACFHRAAETGAAGCTRYRGAYAGRAGFHRAAQTRPCRPAGARAGGVADDGAAARARRIARGGFRVAAAAASGDPCRPRCRSRRHARAGGAAAGYAVAPYRHSRRFRRRQERAAQPAG